MPASANCENYVLYLVSDIINIYIYACIERVFLYMYVYIHVYTSPCVYVYDVTVEKPRFVVGIFREPGICIWYALAC